MEWQNTYAQTPRSGSFTSENDGSPERTDGRSISANAKKSPASNRVGLKEMKSFKDKVAKIFSTGDEKAFSDLMKRFNDDVLHRERDARQIFGNLIQRMQSESWSHKSVLWQDCEEFFRLTLVCADLRVVKRVKDLIENYSPDQPQPSFSSPAPAKPKTERKRPAEPQMATPEPKAVKVSEASSPQSSRLDAYRADSSNSSSMAEEMYWKNKSTSISLQIRQELELTEAMVEDPIHIQVHNDVSSDMMDVDAPMEPQLPLQRVVIVFTKDPDESFPDDRVSSEFADADIVDGWRFLAFIADTEFQTSEDTFKTHAKSYHNLQLLLERFCFAKRVADLSMLAKAIEEDIMPFGKNQQRKSDANCRYVALKQEDSQILHVLVCSDLDERDEKLVSDFRASESPEDEDGEETDASSGAVHVLVYLNSDDVIDEQTLAEAEQRLPLTGLSITPRSTIEQLTSAIKSEYFLDHLINIRYVDANDLTNWHEITSPVGQFNNRAIESLFTGPDDLYRICALLPSTAKLRPIVIPERDDQQRLTIQDKCRIFDNQVFVAKRIVQRMYDSGAVDPDNYDSVSFAFATEVSLSLQEQTAQRVADAVKHVNFVDSASAGSPKFEERRVWMYHPCNLGDKPENRSPKFKHFFEIVQKNPRTLFIYFADECHVQAGKGMVPHEFFMRLENQPNVVQLLISATPWNAMTRDSTIPHRHIVMETWAPEQHDDNQFHSLEEMEIVLITNSRPEEKAGVWYWQGMREKHLDLGIKWIRIDCLDAEELHIITWNHKSRRNGSKEVITIEKRLEAGFEVRLPSGQTQMVQKSFFSSNIAEHMPIQIAGGVRYWSIDDYMERTRKYYQQDKTHPQHGPGYCTDQSFNLFYDRCRYFITKKRGGPKSQTEAVEFKEQYSNNERVLLAEYQLGMLFVKCFMASDFKFASDQNATPSVLFDPKMFHPFFRPSPDPSSSADPLELFDQRFEQFIEGVEWVMRQTELDRNQQPMASWEKGHHKGSFILLRLTSLLAESKFLLPTNYGVLNSKPTPESHQDKVRDRSAFFETAKGSQFELKSELKTFLKEFYRQKLQNIKYLFSRHRNLIGRGAAAVEASVNFTAACESWSFTDDLLYDLITRRGTRPKEDGPLYENDWWGPLTGTMKLVRVLSATGATSFGACLRRLRDRIGWSTCFAVHADISSNKPDENSGRLLEEQFLVNMQQGRCEVEGCKCETFELQRGGKSNDTITCKTCSGKHAHRPYWTYDSLKVPIILILVQKGSMGDTFPFDKRQQDSGLGFNCFDLRVKHYAGPSSLSSIVQELGRMCRYSDGQFLPYALVSDKLIKGILGKASPHKVFSKSDLCSSRAVDRYMSIDAVAEAAPASFKAQYPTATWRAYYQAGRSGQKKKEHRDFGNFEKQFSTITPLDSGRVFRRRFLLEAEPQIGKTGTALWVAIQLHNDITLGEMKIEAPENVLPLPRISVSQKLCKTHLQWKYPYGVMCQHHPELPYNLLKSGKYHLRVFVSRLKVLADASTKPDAWVATFIDLICRHEQVYDRKIFEPYLSSLQGKSLDFVKFGTCSGEVTVECHQKDLRRLLEAVDWDSRLKRYETKTENKAIDPPHFEDAVLFGLLRRSGPNKFTVVKKTEAAYSMYTEGKLHKHDSARYNVFTKDTIVTLPKRPTLRYFRMKSNGFTFAKAGVVQISVPPDMEDRFVVADKYISSINHDKCGRWVFNPSYKRHEANHLKYDSKMSTKPYTQVIVVRPNLKAGENLKDFIVGADEREFDLYQERFGHSHIILQLPRWIETPDKTRKSVVEGSIGFARLFIQLFAYSIGLEFVHVWDDNVIKCHRLDAKSITQIGAISQECLRTDIPFDEAMKALETIVYPDQGDEHDLLTHADCSEANQEYLKENTTAPLTCKSARHEHPGADSISEYTGDKSNYALIGMRRDMPHLAAYKGKSSKPFLVTHSVYSAILLNVKSTVEAGVFYPMKPVWEDVEFAHMCRSKGLFVVKSNTIFHQKVNKTGNKSVDVPLLIRNSLSLPAQFQAADAIDAAPGDQPKGDLIDLLEELVGSDQLTWNTQLLHEPKESPPDRLTQVLAPPDHWKQGRMKPQNIIFYSETFVVDCEASIQLCFTRHHLLRAAIRDARAQHGSSVRAFMITVASQISSDQDTAKLEPGFVQDVKFELKPRPGSPVITPRNTGFWSVPASKRAEEENGDSTVFFASNGKTILVSSWVFEST